MKKYFQKFNIAIIVFLLISCDSVNNSNKNYTEKYNKSNFPICGGGIDGEAVCQVGGSDLSVMSPRIDGRMIEIIGYLVIDSGMLSIYQNENDYVLGVNTQSLRIRAKLIDQKRLFLNYGYGYVKIIGKYKSDDEDAIRMGRAGSLTLVSDEHVKIRGRRENLQDLRVNIDDIK
jgi:hypothetical protein